jgi:hypothetical protein
MCGGTERFTHLLSVTVGVGNKKKKSNAKT